MAQPPVTPFAPETLRYFRKSYVPTSAMGRRWWLLSSIATIPFRSLAGGRAIARAVGGDAPAAWQRDFAGKRALIIGSGPSLDRVDEAFFASFDVRIYINFALRRATGEGSEYFFTTDAGPLREFVDAHGAGPFRQLGKDRCVIAPIWLDQWNLMTDEGRELFTWLRFDEAQWYAQPFTSVPLLRILRYYPRQPEWETFTLPPHGRVLPVLRYTSALTAVLFAAMGGAKEIGLIGCDFSAGRAGSVGSSQEVPDARTFSGAAAEFGKMRDALKRHGIAVTNHSWEV